MFASRGVSSLVLHPSGETRVLFVVVGHAVEIAYSCCASGRVYRCTDWRQTCPPRNEAGLASLQRGLVARLPKPVPCYEKKIRTHQYIIYRSNGAVTDICPAVRRRSGCLGWTALRAAFNHFGLQGVSKRERDEISNCRDRGSAGQRSRKASSPTWLAAVPTTTPASEPPLTSIPRRLPSMVIQQKSFCPYTHPANWHARSIVEATPR